MRKQWSEEAGVSLAYLLSDEFLTLAQERSHKEDPSFDELVEALVFGDLKVGQDRVIQA